MLILSKLNFVLSLFLAFNCVLLTVNAATTKDEPPTQPIVNEPSNESNETSKATETPPEIAPEVDVNLPVVTLNEVADEFVLLSTSVLPKVDNISISRVLVQYSVELEGVWVAGVTRPEKVKIEKVAKRKDHDRGLFQWKISGLKPGLNYRFFVSALYGQKSYPENPEPLQVTTKGLAPKVSIAKMLPVLSFERMDVKSYHVQINKAKKDRKESDCIFEATIAPAFSNHFILPELIVGEQYSIKTWYIDANGLESYHVIQEFPPSE